MIMVSTDGSCLKNPGGAIGWAWVDHRGGAHSGGAAAGTNQIAELRAVLEAISAHPGDEPLMIESDSQYAIKCSTEWLPAWKRRGWKTSGGSPVKNVELVRAIDSAISERSGPVRFRWVRGHVGNEFNEMADTLAGKAARAARDGKIVATQAPGTDRFGAADSAPDVAADAPDGVADAAALRARDPKPADRVQDHEAVRDEPPAQDHQPALFPAAESEEFTLF
ncbi:ribonuclease H family protein [Tomitella fengzijianii]|uniref:ribonuclease H n=1 Tax=Tomitella fengzijianii TaxID=2597660 RepID=A0A516X657_9ACTN|nr:ribonuclease HI [Tomitella fengzijianii]